VKKLGILVIQKEAGPLLTKKRCQLNEKPNLKKKNNVDARDRRDESSLGAGDGKARAEMRKICLTGMEDAEKSWNKRR